MSSGSATALVSLASILSVLFIFGFFIVLTLVLQGVIRKLQSGVKTWNEKKNFFLFESNFQQAPRSSFAYFSLWCSNRLIIALLIVFTHANPIAQCLFIALSSLFVGACSLLDGDFRYGC